MSELESINNLEIQLDSASPEPEKPKFTIYKGTDKTVEEAAKLPVGTVIQVMEVNGTTKYGSGTKFPGRVCILENISNTNNKDIKRIDVLDKKNFNKTSVYVDKTHIIRELSGTVKKDVSDRYSKWKSQNLYTHIIGTNPGFYTGFDPEFFVENSAKKESLIPGFFFLPDKKETEMINGIRTFNDNFAAEFNVQQQTCLQILSDEVQRGLYSIYTAAKAQNKNAKISSKTVIKLPPNIESLIENKKYLQLGCSPSLNAYGLEGNLKGNILYRSCGGHIHFGIGKVGTKYSKEQIEEAVKSLDALTAIACVSLLEKFDDPIRREYYGLPGEYRLPNHGMEYRVLSNAYMFHPAIFNLVIDFARKAMLLGLMGYRNEINEKDEEIMDIILSSDVKRARQFMDKHKVVFLGVLSAAYRYGTECSSMGFEVLRNGMHEYVENPTNIEHNWSITGPRWVAHAGGVNKCWSKAAPFLAKKGNKI